MSDPSPSTMKTASFISDGLVVQGNISGEGNMRLNGKIQGDINLRNGALHIEPSGIVEGNIVVRQLVIAGKVKGTIETSEALEIAATGRFEGEVKTQSLQVEEGAILNAYFEVKGQQ